MGTPQLPTIKFDGSKARVFYPRPIIKTAMRFVPPTPEGGGELPTSLRPEWGGVQSFFGEFYVVAAENGDVAYGSAALQWTNMHRRCDDGDLTRWVKVAPVNAYVAEAPGLLATFVYDPYGGTRETAVTVVSGHWIVRQPGGEVQHIRPENFTRLYFTEEEARRLELTSETFEAWAIANAGLVLAG